MLGGSCRFIDAGVCAIFRVLFERFGQRVVLEMDMIVFDNSMGIPLYQG